MLQLGESADALFLLTVKRMGSVGKQKVSEVQLINADAYAFVLSNSSLGMIKKMLR